MKETTFSLTLKDIIAFATGMPSELSPLPSLRFTSHCKKRSVQGTLKCHNTHTSLFLKSVCIVTFKKVCVL